MQPSSVRKLLSKSPVFRDDKLVYPLQAADVLAWHVRKRFEQNPNLFQVPEMLSTTGYHMASDIDAEHLRSMARGYSQIPGVDRIKNRGAWKKARREIRRLEESGFTPPYKIQGLKNTLLYARQRLARLFRF